MFIFIAVLFLFLAVTSVLVSYQQQKLLHDDIYINAVKSLDLMADATLEALLKSDYVTVRTFVARWGETHSEIHEIRVTAPNGFSIAEYRVQAAKNGETYSLTREVSIEDTPLATIHLVGDYQSAEKIASQLRNRLFFLAFIITALLGIALWITFRSLALAPLEDMVTERTQALSITNEALELEIAERVNTEKTLREREEHITMILNSIAEGIYGVDVEEKCTFCNPAALKILGYEREEDILGKNVHRLIHHTLPDGSAYPAEDCTIYRSFRTGEGCHVDTEVFWRSNGTSFPVEYWAQPIVRDGRPIGAVTAFIDISERRLSEEALRDQEEELSAIFRNAPYLMILLDKNRRVVRGNSASFEHSGESGDAVVGSMLGEVLHCINSINNPEGCGSGPRCSSCVVHDSVLDTMETGRNHYQLEAHLQVTDGEHNNEIVVLISTARLSVRNQPMVLVSLHDITENKRLEAQLRQAQKMESIGTFAGGIAHDFNNILSVILGYGEMALSELEKDSPLRSSVEHMIEAGERATHLTRDLLLFSRKQVLDRRPVELNEIIRKMEKFLARVIGEDITCSARLYEGELIVLADAHQLEQIMVNLATNARDSMPKGGTFTITTEQVILDEELTHELKLGLPGRYALISVSDTGEGMTEETRQRIFDPFFTTKEVGKGTGLGLSVVYGIVKQHDGLVNVYSEQGIGTTFRIYLPLIASGRTEEKQQTEIRPPGRGTETILLAEDNENLLNLMNTILKGSGYTVITAIDGEDAVEKYRENRDRIQLLIFDLIMPGKSGKEACDEIRKIDPDIKIIFTTGYSPDIIRDKASLDPDVTIIHKPISSADLLNRVRKTLDTDETRLS